MQIAAMTFRLHAPWVHSLKEKRMIVKSLVQSCKANFTYPPQKLTSRTRTRFL